MAPQVHRAVGGDAEQVLAIGHHRVAARIVHLDRVIVALPGVRVPFLAEHFGLGAVGELEVGKGLAGDEVGLHFCQVGLAGESLFVAQGRDVDALPVLAEHSNAHSLDAGHGGPLVRIADFEASVGLLEGAHQGHRNGRGRHRGGCGGDGRGRGRHPRRGYRRGGGGWLARGHQSQQQNQRNEP